MSEWWSGVLEYSFLSTEWWESLLQGSVGSLLSLLGVFGIFWATKTREDKKERQTRLRELQDASENRTLAGVADIVRATLTVRAAVPDPDSALRHLADELMMFSVREIRDHRNAAMWASRLGRDILHLTDDDQQIRAIGWQAGWIASRLTIWIQRGFPENMLTEDDVKRADKMREARMEEITPKVTWGDVKNKLRHLHEETRKTEDDAAYNSAVSEQDPS